jgi:hypothetical protein
MGKIFMHSCQQLEVEFDILTGTQTVTSKGSLGSVLDVNQANTDIL